MKQKRYIAGMILNILKATEQFPTSNLNDYLKKQNLNRELQMEIIVFILREYNPRISEVLNLEKENCIAPNLIVLKGLKGSSDIIIHDHQLFCSLQICMNENRTRVFDVKYSQVYNFIFKRYPNLIIVRKGKNNSVTHSSRYKNAESFVLVNQSNKTIKSLLHHNSLISQKFYKKGLNQNG